MLMAITMYFAGGQGVEICSSQDTPISVHKDNTYLMFGVDVHVPVPLEDLAQGLLQVTNLLLRN